MDLQLRGRTALITGGSKGIGRSAAESMAAEGCDVILVSRTLAALEDAAGSIRSRFQVNVRVHAADIAVQGTAEDIAARFPDIDILVNNAGAIPGGSLGQVDGTTWRQAWQLKVFGYIDMCRAFYPLLQARSVDNARPPASTAPASQAQGGRPPSQHGSGAPHGTGSGARPGQGATDSFVPSIINVVGNAAETLDQAYICGVTGNAALYAFTRSLGGTAPNDGLRVVGLSPGPVATDRLIGLMKKKASDRTGDAERWQELFAPMPFGRAATPEEIGDMIAFLASPRSGFTSGTIVTIDGGMAARSRAF
ncbi:MAG: SDR family oxidoreductase [Acetobacteraceae bacterium]|nr:SDR family oxidoreductase [Acetobacteraceae bacterium]